MGLNKGTQTVDFLAIWCHGWIWKCQREIEQRQRVVYAKNMTKAAFAVHNIPKTTKKGLKCQIELS